MIRFIKTLIHDFLYDWYLLRDLRNDSEFRKKHSIFWEHFFVLSQWALWTGGLLIVIAFPQIILCKILTWGANIPISKAMFVVNAIIVLYILVYEFLTWYGENPQRPTLLGVNDKWMSHKLSR